MRESRRDDTLAQLSNTRKAAHECSPRRNPLGEPAEEVEPRRDERNVLTQKHARLSASGRTT
jgi:hypothetical protein